MTNEIKPTDINWLKDGERAEAIVLNRPIENLRVAINQVISDLNSKTVFRTSPRKPTEQNIQLLENDFVEVDTSDGPKTLTMPNTNKLGTTVFLIDIKGTWGETPAILKGNGKPIMRRNEDLELDISNVTAKFVLTNEGWTIL